MQRSKLKGIPIRHETCPHKSGRHDWVVSGAGPDRFVSCNHCKATWELIDTFGEPEYSPSFGLAVSMTVIKHVNPPKYVWAFDPSTKTYTLKAVAPDGCMNTVFMPCGVPVYRQARP